VSRRRTLALKTWALWASIALLTRESEGLRPFRTDDNRTVPLGHVGLELAADLAFEKSDRSVVFPALSLKAGVADRVELDLEGGYQFVRSEGSKASGLTDTTLKVKARLYDGADAIPSLATTLGMVLPTEDPSIRPSRDLGFLALAQASSDFQSFIYYANIGLELSEAPREQRNELHKDLLWGLAFEIPIYANAALAIDFFGRTQPDSGVAQSGLMGVIWRSPWKIDFDFAVIAGLTPGADDVGLTMGLTYQFPVFGAAGQQQAQRRSSIQDQRSLQGSMYQTERLLRISRKQMLQVR
jgi:hypothetical protein